MYVCGLDTFNVLSHHAVGPLPSLRVLQSKSEEGRFKVDEEYINGLNHMAKVSQWYIPPVPCEEEHKAHQ